MTSRIADTQTVYLADAILRSLPRLEEEARVCEGGGELADRLIPAVRQLNETSNNAVEQRL